MTGPLVTVVLDFQTVVGLAVSVAALVGALGYLWRKARAIAKIVAANYALIQRELTNNGGKSMKDEVQALGVAVPALSRMVDKLDEALTLHLDDYPKEEHK